MTDHINPTHASLEAAAKPMTLNAIAKRLHGATPTKTQLKATERELKALHQAGLLESIPGRGGLPHYRLTTPTAPAAPQPKPSAAAVAVGAALDGGPTPVPDLAEQLREAHAERLAMSQTIIAICCAIGRDPGQTTTAELPQALRDYIGAQVERETSELTGIIADIRAAIPAGEHLDASDLAIATQKTMVAAKRDRDVLDVIRNTLAAVAADLTPDCGATTTEPEAIRIMAQLIEAQHEHIQDQAHEIEALSNDLHTAGRLLADQEQQIANLRVQLADQAAQHQAETGLLADKNAKLHAELEHLRSQPAPVACGKADPAPEAFFVLRHDWKHHVTRHKSRETAERTVTSALRAGAGQADIYAAKRIATGKRRPVIESV